MEQDHTALHEEPDTGEEGEEGGPPAPTNGAGDASSSVLGQLRSRRRRLGEKTHLDMEIPGYNGLLFARYRRVPWEDLKKITLKAEKSKSPVKELLGQADVLIVACQEILVREPSREDADEEGLAPIDPDSSRMEPTRFDRNLARILGFSPDELEDLTARKVVFGVFQNDLAVTVQQNEVMEWAASNQEEIDEELEGESTGTILSS